MSRALPTPSWTGSLWLPIVSPVAWTLHLLATYVTAALGCGRAPMEGATMQALIVGYTAAAVAIMAAMFAIGRRSHGSGWQPNDEDSTDARWRFVGLTTMLLAGLSILATAMVAGGALAAGGCG